MNNSEIHVCVYSTNKLPHLCEAYWAVIVKFTLKVTCGIILYEYEMKYTEYQISFDCMNNAGKKHKLRLSQIQHDLQRFKYHWLHCSCIAEPPFCLTWCPTNIMFRSAVGIIRRHNKNGKYRCINYDKESYVYFNRWSISVGLVAWINWESTIMFFWLHFKPTGKTPLPFRNLLPSDPTTPQNVPDTLWGEGVWIF